VLTLRVIAGRLKLKTTCEVTAALEQALLQRITAARYDLWFHGKTKLTLAGDRLVVGVANLHYQDWLQKKFGADVRAAAAEVIGEPVPTAFVIDPELFQAQRQTNTMVVAPSASASDALPAPPAPESIRRGLRRWRRLDDFVVGSCNRVAHAAALGVVEEPGLTPIPMVLHGPVGAGKSHLLEGIRAGLSEKYPDARILFLTAEDFTNRFLAAMHQGKQPGFRRQFRECDVLLVDDLQFLAKKTATQIEFLHTLETLQREGRTVVVTCDCHPRLAEVFQPELTDRLVGGAVHGLAWPDPATRRLLLVAKTLGKATLPGDVLDLLTERLRGNVRELEGAIHSLLHLAKATERPITLPLAQESLAETLRASVRTVGLPDVDRAVVAVLELPHGALQSKKRNWQISGPRMLAMFLARKHTSATYSEVGQHFGQRNHSTAVAAEKRVRLWLADQESILVGTKKSPVKDVIERIEAELAR
jgi:chromosomal replication initiator protein